MIKIKNIGKYMALAVCLIFASCSNDDDNVPSVSFPELQTIECEVNKTADISFESIGSWKLSSSALWCQFVVDGEQVFSCQGNAGKQNIQVIVTDDATELMKSYTASITLEIGGQEKVIYKVSRPVAGYELHVFDADGNEFSEGQPVVMIYNRPSSFKVSANCTWALVSAPDWMTVKSTNFSDANQNSAVCGSEADVISANAEIANTFQYISRMGELVFKSEDGQKTVTIPVVYDGMPEDAIEFSLASNNRFNWSFSADGFTLSSGSDMGSSTTIDAPMSIGVWAKNQEYEYVRLSRDESGGYMQMNAWDAWVYVENVKDSETEFHIEINVAENHGDERRGCVMVFPKAVYDRISNFDEMILTVPDYDIKPEYAKYVAFDFTQKAPAGSNGGFTFFDEEGIEVPLNMNNYMSYADMAGVGDAELIAMYGTSNVWMFMPERPYDMLKIIPAGAGEWWYAYDTYHDGIDTTIDGVTLTEDYSGGSKPSFFMYGLNKKGNMTIKFMDNGGNVYAVLIIEAWF